MDWLDRLKAKFTWAASRDIFNYRGKPAFPLALASLEEMEHLHQIERLMSRIGKKNRISNRQTQSQFNDLTLTTMIDPPGFKFWRQPVGAQFLVPQLMRLQRPGLDVFYACDDYAMAKVIGYKEGNEAALLMGGQFLKKPAKAAPHAIGLR